MQRPISSIQELDDGGSVSTGEYLDALEQSIPRSVNSLNKLTCRIIVEGIWWSDCLLNPCRFPPFLVSQRE